MAAVEYASYFVAGELAVVLDDVVVKIEEVSRQELNKRQ